MPTKKHGNLLLAINTYAKIQRDIKEQQKPMLLIEAAPLDYAISSAHLTQDLLIAIGNYYDVKNELKSTCRFMNKTFSKTKPNMYQLVLDGARFSKKDINHIILNAAWDKRTDVMINILNNTQERQFYYDVFLQYNSQKGSGQRCVVFDLPEICTINGMRSSDDIITFPLSITDVDGNVFRYNLKKAKLFTIQKRVPLLIAIAFGTKEDIAKALESEIDNIHGLISAFVIAIEHDNLDCIRALSSKAKKMERNDNDDSNFRMAYDAVLTTAMVSNKKEAFELLAKKDPFDCLNACVSDRSTLNRLGQMYYVDNQDEFLDIYKKHGGKYYSTILHEAINKEEEEKIQKKEIEKEDELPLMCVIS